MKSKPALARRAFLQQAPAALVGAATLPATLARLSSAADAPAPMFRGALRWKQDAHSVALLHGDQVVWQHNHRAEEGKPYFHPVNLLDGTPLTWLRPSDHQWHRALWFSWKEINGLNYWDPDLNPPGRSTPVAVNVRTRPDFSASLELSLDYHPVNQPPVLKERRDLRLSAPDSQGLYAMEWISTFTAQKEPVRFERTPIVGEPNGVAHGGYAGLSFRIARELADWQVINSQERQKMEGHGRPARWVDFSGRTRAGKAAGAAILDHAGNPRHPSPWFLAIDEKAPFGYFNPAFLFNGPYQLMPGKSFTLAYKILIHPGRPEIFSIDAEWRKFSARRFHSGQAG